MLAIDGVQSDDLQPDKPRDSTPSESRAEDSVRVTHHKGHTVVSLTGAVDRTDIESLHAAMLGLVNDDQDIIVDCSKADHLDSCALQVLLATQIGLAARQHNVRIELESPGIRQYLSLAGVAERFPPQTPTVRAKKKRTPKAAKQP